MDPLNGLAYPSLITESIQDQSGSSEPVCWLSSTTRSNKDAPFESINELSIVKQSLEQGEEELIFCDEKQVV